MDADSYLSIKERSEGLFKSKGSKHFGYAFPVTSEDDVKKCLDQIRSEHHSARHHCYAYRLKHDGSVFRSSDDGEPNNSAGPPILGVLKSHHLTETLIIVVRYFGGTKLGVSGLIEAYREAGNEAISNGEIITKIRSNTYRISYPYSLMGDVMNVLKRFGIGPKNTDFQMDCKLEATVRLNDSGSFENSINDIIGAEIEQI